jgi:hypothetical protein
MSFLDLDKSLKKAEERLGVAPRTRKRRADAGGTRLPAPVVSELRRLLGGKERPRMREVGRELATFCEARGWPRPARATLYRFMAEVPIHEYHAAELPAWVRASLYNLEGDARVPGHQLVFYAFNYGDARAMSFAAALPWVDLYQAARMRGWRAMSLGPLRAAMRRRKIG